MHFAINPDPISIHVPRVEDDMRNTDTGDVRVVFQSTSPVWRTTIVRKKSRESRPISIHVPRVEDDL